MGKYVKNFEVHDFYCSKCGRKGLPIARRDSLKKEKFHKKKLYCLYCKEEVNHIEIKSELEAKEFQLKFAEGGAF